MKDRAAMQAAGASQQSVESSGASQAPIPPTGGDTEKRVKKTAAPGLTFPRFFTEAGVDPFDEVEWELRSAVIGAQGGEVVFEQRDQPLSSHIHKLTQLSTSCVRPKREPQYLVDRC